MRRIFAEYVNGKPVTAIARDLTAGGIPGPRGGAWSAPSITGNAQRRSGMIPFSNELGPSMSAGWSGTGTVM